jgi:cytochrome c biogenesis protein CcdA
MGIKEMVRVVQPGGHVRSFTDFFSLSTALPRLLVLLTVAASQAGTAYGVLLSFAFGLGCEGPFHSPTTFHAPIALNTDKT